MHPKAGTLLARRLSSAQDYDQFEVNIFLSGEPARDYLLATDEISSLDNESTGIPVIKEQCAERQRDLVSFLDSCRTEADFIVDDGVSVPQVGRVETFWINNSVSATLSLSTLERVLNRSDVEYVELVHRVEIEELLDVAIQTATTTFRGRSRASVDAANPTWSVTRVNAPLLWQKGLDGKGVIVAVLDTGVNYEHPDLKEQMWDGGSEYPKHGYDFASHDKDPKDEGGHGTSCAGIVAGNGNSGTSTGVAPGATIMAVRVGGEQEQFWKGMEFALDQGANVISMSMSWKYPWNPNYPGWRRVCETILAAGVLHANSIGNQGNDLFRFPIPYNIATPGNCPPPRLHPLQPIIGDISSAIACGATDDSDQLAGYSGRGPAAWENAPYTDYPYQNGARPGLIKPDVCAPGPGTTSCNWRYPQQPFARPYSPFGGTSSATPHVAGCITLLVQACMRSGQTIVPARIQEALENTAVRIFGQTRDKENHYGAGRVDVYAAFKYGEAKGWWS